MFNIAFMILLMFVLLGILVITLLVYLADDEVEMLIEIPDIDSSIFKHELREVFTFVPFCFMCFVLFMNLTLITRDSIDEIWFYMK